MGHSRGLYCLLPACFVVVLCGIEVNGQESALSKEHSCDEYSDCANEQGDGESLFKSDGCDLDETRKPLISWDMLYTSETFRNARGGTHVGGAYSGLVDLVGTVDIEQLGFKSLGGIFVLHGQNKHGPGIHRFVGASQSTNIDANPFTAMAEYYYQREFGDSTTVRVGRQVGAYQFSVLDLAADFTYGGFQRSPNNPVPWYPTPTAGVVGIHRVGDAIELSAGSFASSNPNQLSPWGWSRDGHMYNVAQWRYHYSLGTLPGDIQNGAWYTSGSHQGELPGVHSGNHGVYAGWNQMLWSETEDSKQGLGTFLIYSWAPSDRNRITNHYAGGLVYRGLLPSRPQDNLGLGLSVAEFSQSQQGNLSERTVELYYARYVSDAFVIQPAIHYIAAPNRTNPDALAFGLRFELAM